MSASAARARAVLGEARAIITGSHIVYTSGKHGSAYVNKDAVAAVRAAGGIVVAVAALVNRGAVTAADVGVPALVALLDIALDAWDADACPLCRDGVPVNTDVGKGREFLAKRG